MQAAIQRQTREEAILMSLRNFDYLSCSQLQRMHRLGKKRNAQRVLHEMKDYLSTFKDGENIYYLNAAGRERVGCKTVRKKTLQARHYIMRNELYLALNRPVTWKNEKRFKVKTLGVELVCDARYTNGDRYTFIEVDHTQRMNKNRVKIQKYRKLFEAFKIQPELIWITTTEHRRERLKELCKGLKFKVFTIEDLR